MLCLVASGGTILRARADDFSEPVLAAPTSEVSSDKIQDLLNSKWNKNSGQTSVSFDGAAYEYSPRTEEGAIYPALVGHWSDSSENALFKAVGNVEAMVIVPPSLNSGSQFDSPQFYFEMPEAYVGTSSRLGPVQVSAGRKLEEWNHLDDLWKLGIWQPRFNWDYLNPEIVGLTGAFIDFQQPHFKFVGFATGVFIPERGVPINTDDGQLTSDSPFFTPPPRNVSVFDSVTPTQYDLQMPSMSSIVFNPGVSLMARIGDSTGPWISGAYGYLPVNQLLIAYNGQVKLSDDGGTGTVVVPLTPMVAYHTLGSLDMGYSGDRFDFWVSNLIDRPYEPQAPAGWTYQQISNSYAVSPAVEARFGSLPRNPIRAQLSYLGQWGGNAPDYSPDGSTSLSSGSVFEPRYPFQRAMLLGGQVPLANFSSELVPMFGQWVNNVSFLSRYIFDFGHDGAILSSDIKYRPTPSWEIGVGADLLGSGESTTSGVEPSDFIARYAANDRIRWSLTYVF
jgi:hypothetical protein